MPTSICTIRFQIRTIPCLALNLPPLSKVRCCRPIKFGRRPEGLPHHHPSPRTNPSKTALYHPLFVMPTSICTIRFHIRTILFAFRRARGCVCFLVSHPCETMGTHAKASLPCLPLPLHQSLLFSLIFVKEHLSLALLAPPVAPTHSITTTIAKEQQSLAQHFPYKPKDRTSSQVRSYLF